MGNRNAEAETVADEDHEIEMEISKIQREKLLMISNKNKAKEESEDSDEEDGSDEEEDFQNRTKKRLKQYTAPDAYLNDFNNRDDVNNATNEDLEQMQYEDSVFGKSKKIANRESEYQRRRFKRELSPERALKNTDDGDDQKRGYKDAMREAIIEREREETLRNIESKRVRESEEEERRKLIVSVRDDDDDDDDKREEEKNSRQKSKRKSRWDTAATATTNALDGNAVAVMKDDSAADTEKVREHVEREQRQRNARVARGWDDEDDDTLSESVGNKNKKKMNDSSNEWDDDDFDNNNNNNNNNNNDGDDNNADDDESKSLISIGTANAAINEFGFLKTPKNKKNIMWALTGIEEIHLFDCDSSNNNNNNITSSSSSTCGIELGHVKNAREKARDAAKKLLKSINMTSAEQNFKIGLKDLCENVDYIINVVDGPNNQYLASLGTINGTVGLFPIAYENDDNLDSETSTQKLTLLMPTHILPPSSESLAGGGHVDIVRCLMATNLDKDDYNEDKKTIYTGGEDSFLCAWNVVYNDNEDSGDHKNISGAGAIRNIVRSGRESPY